jgi:hypothetical protein
MNANKNQKNIFLRIAGLVSRHPWLKLISLLLAVIVWFYVRGEGV